MENEIKEILDCIKDPSRDYVGFNGCVYQDLDRFELNLLIEYINYLQQKYENSQITLSNEWKKRLELEEKNINLKKKIKFNEKSRRKMESSLMKQIEYYKLLINNVNKYILDNYSNNDGTIWHTELKYIYDFLNRK